MRFFGFFIVLVLIGFMFPTSSVSAFPSEDVLIFQVQTFGNGLDPSYEEFILLYNSSDDVINVTDWCIEYVSSTGATVTELACVEPPDNTTELWLTADKYISFATTEFITANSGFVADFDFVRKLNNDSGHVRLINGDLEEVDKLGWGDAISPEGLFAADVHATGEVMSRDILAADIDTDINLVDFSSQTIMNPISSGLYEKEIIVDLCPNIDGVQIILPDGFLQNIDGDCFEDFCPNLDELQLVVPVGYEKLLGEEDCTLIPLESATLFVTELMINAPSYDSGLEFIEIYNPNDTVIDLVGYRLQLGLSFSKEFVFVTGVIRPGEYLTFFDSDTGIVLPNTSSSSVRLIAPAGNTVSETAVYSNADDDVSWALVSDVWIYTNQITPNAANKPYLEPAVSEVLGVTSVLAPCSAGKYRNPETNRCRNIETAISQLAPCASDQFRNPETNRCKSISSSTSGLVPCKENQERSPETNRCRNVTVLGSTTGLTDVSDVAVQSNEGQLNWPIIIASVGGTLAYMVYEWRSELSYKFRRIRVYGR